MGFGSNLVVAKKGFVVAKGGLGSGLAVARRGLGSGLVVAKVRLVVAW